MNAVTAEALQRLGVVLIGRNEGARLLACLASIADSNLRVVYVDSGSTDGSVEAARRAGAEVVELDMSIPFSAGRARNAGFYRLLELAPNLVFVQFVDGDCEIVPGWFVAALRAIEARPELAIVYGRRREKHPEKSVYNELCDIEWDTPVGDSRMCGGDMLIRVKAFREVRGFNPSLVAGEEPDLCLRLRKRGWKILRIAEEMTLHDAAITKLSQWCKRTIRAGHAYAELSTLHYTGSPEAFGVRKTLSNVGWGAVLPSAVVVGLAQTPVSALAATLYLWPFVRTYRHQLREGRKPRAAALYSLALTGGKFLEALGAARFAVGLATGRRSRIIEYK